MYQYVRWLPTFLLLLLIITSGLSGAGLEWYVILPVWAVLRHVNRRPIFHTHLLIY
jgi:hypothetical protein